MELLKDSSDVVSEGGVSKSSDSQVVGRDPKVGHVLGGL